MYQVKLKWNKETFDNVEVNTDESVGDLKRKLYQLTGVPADRQKLMCKGGWVGVLKDDANLKSVKLSNNQQILLMGTAEEVVAAPKEAITFFEDMTADQKAEKGVVVSAGLVNLGNTCYMNSTVQCFRHMPELREELKLIRSNAANPDLQFTAAFRDSLNQLDTSGVSIPPFQFVSALRTHFPQFGQRGEGGHFMQQDAEEFFNILVNSVDNSLHTVNNSLDGLLNLQLEETLTCEETDLEPAIVRSERVNKLVVNIKNDSAGTVNHLHEGVKIAFEGTIEKQSEVLHRNALWKRHQRIAVLPKYICFHFMRFFWRATPESRDHTGVKCKILRNVHFSDSLDVYDFCNEALQVKLRRNREVEAKKADALFQLKQSNAGGASTSSVTAASSSAASEKMEVEGENEDDEEAAALQAAMAMSVAPLESHSVMPPNPPAVTSSTELAPVDIGNGLPVGFSGHYELHSIVTHKGRSADSGHYIGWTRQAPGSSVWWKYDDDTVTEVNADEIALLTGGGDRHMAYLTFYRYKESKL